MDSREFDVNVGAEPGVEEQVPAGIMIVGIDEDLIAAPIPIAATRSVVGSDHPVGVVRENKATSANVEPVGDEFRADVIVTAIGIEVAGTEMIVRVVVVDDHIAPDDGAVDNGLVMHHGIMMYNSVMMFDRLVMLDGLLMLDLAIVLAVVVMIVAVLWTLSRDESACQSEKQKTQEKLLHHCPPRGTEFPRASELDRL